MSTSSARVCVRILVQRRVERVLVELADLGRDLGEPAGAGPARERPVVRAGADRRCRDAGRWWPRVRPPRGAGSGFPRPPLPGWVGVGRASSTGLRRRTPSTYSSRDDRPRASGRSTRAAGSGPTARPARRPARRASRRCWCRATRPARPPMPARSMAPRTDEPIRTSGCSRVRRTRSTTLARQSGSTHDRRAASTICCLGRRRSGSPSRCGRCGRTPPPRSARCRRRRRGSSPRPGGTRARPRTRPSRGTCSSPSLITVMQDVERLLGDAVELLDVEQRRRRAAPSTSGPSTKISGDVALGQHPRRVEVPDQPGRASARRCPRRRGTATSRAAGHGAQQGGLAGAGRASSTTWAPPSSAARAVRPRARARRPRRSAWRSRLRRGRGACSGHVSARGRRRRGRSCRRAGRRSPR